MIGREDLSSTMSDWFDDQAGRGAPDYLDDVLDRTVRIRQRPAWSSLERWLPVATMTRSRFAPVPRVAWLLIIAGLLIALATAVLVGTGSMRRTAPPFGPAGNGLIAFSREVTAGGGSYGLFVADAHGNNVRRLAENVTGVFSPTFSPDGSKLAFWTKQGDENAPHHLMVMNVDESNLVDVSGPAGYNDSENVGDNTLANVSWSSSSTRLAFSSPGPAGFGAGRPIHLWIVNADGSGLHSIGDDSRDREAPAWSPNDAWIGYLSSSIGGDERKLSVIHPDGTGGRQATTEAVSLDGEASAMSWAPDPSLEQLLYTKGGGTSLSIAVFDLQTNRELLSRPGFWASWSPDAARIAWWSDGINVANVSELLPGRSGPVLHPFDPFTSNCQDVQAQLAHKAVCSGVIWSPNGTSLVGHDIIGRSLLIMSIDGSKPIQRIAMFEATALVASWQRVSP